MHKYTYCKNTHITHTHTQFTHTHISQIQTLHTYTHCTHTHITHIYTLRTYTHYIHTHFVRMHTLHIHTHCTYTNTAQIHILYTYTHCTHIIVYFISYDRFAQQKLTHPLKYMSFGNNRAEPVIHKNKLYTGQTTKTIKSVFKAPLINLRQLEKKVFKNSTGFKKPGRIL